MLSAQFVATLFIFIFQSLAPQPQKMFGVTSGIGALVYGGLLVAYWRGWDHARHAAVMLLTFLVAFFLPEPYVTTYAPLAIIIPITLALVLTEPIWVLGSAATILIVLLIRAGFGGVYAHPITLTLYAMIVSGLLLSRLIVDNAQARAEKQAQELIQKNELLTASERRFRALVENSVDEIVVLDPELHVSYVSPSVIRISGLSIEEIRSAAPFSGTHPEDRPLAESLHQELLSKPGESLPYELRLTKHDGSIRWIEGLATNLFDDPSVKGLVLNYRDITARKQADEDLRIYLAEFEAVRQISTALRTAQSLEQMLPLLLDATLKLMNTKEGAIWLFDKTNNELRPAISRGLDQKPGAPPISPQKPREGIVGHVFTSGQPLISRELRSDARISESAREQIPDGVGGAIIPIHVHNSVIGVFMINTRLPHEFAANEIQILTTLSEIAGNAIHRTTLHQQTQLRLQYLTALNEIDHVIASSLDLRLSLHTILSYVQTQLDIDACAVLLLDPNLNTLKYAAGKGFITKAFEHGGPLRIGEGYAGRAIMENRTIHIADMTKQSDNPRLARVLGDEGFISYYGVPLIAKGKNKGVLEVFERVPREHDQDWFDFLDTLAGQTAIAIDNATLFADLQRSNIDLGLAYEATIEGWSHALELRDREAKGHTKRVADMTVQLARDIGLDESEMIHIHRGALLHDIGKMGIPDGILLKPSALTDDEWKVMKRHPELALEMLSPIRYLGTAVDIPYSHHEKWNGSGYPRGLKGNQIPLAARIFAVVDVYDALTSNRPYRPSWSKEKTLEYIRATSGSKCDPLVVDAFIKLFG